MKKGKFGIGSLAKIIFIAVVLFILISMITGLFGQIFKDGIKKLLGEKTESEITHEENIQVIKAFENLEKQIKTCQSSKDNNCGCLINLNAFNKNYEIEFMDKEVKLINIRNIEGKGIQMASFDTGINCYWSNRLEDSSFTKIIFKEEPLIPIKTIFKKDGRFIHKFNMLKKDGRLCWLTNKVKEGKIKNLKECQ